MADETTLVSQAQALFERDPVVGVFSIVVAGNGLPGAAVATVEKQKVLLPDWGMGEWRWWIDLCIGMADAMERARPEGVGPDPALEKLRDLASQARMEVRAEPGLVPEDGPLSGDGIGWLAWAGKVLVAGGRLLKSQAVRVAKWGKPFVKKAAGFAWDHASAIFKKAPFKITAGMALLIAPDYAGKVVNGAAKMAGNLIGGTASSFFSSLGAPGLLVIGAIIYFGFFHGKGE